MKTGRLLILLLAAILPRSAESLDTLKIGGLNGLDPYHTAETYPIVLALSGGGARGLSSIGVLRAFEEKGIVVTGIAGTSIGGVVGGLYSCGFSADQLASIVRNTDFNELFANRPARSTMFLTQRQERDRHVIMVRLDGFQPRIPQGLTSGQLLTSLLSSLTSRAMYQSGGDFSRLKIPFRAVTTDVVSGQMDVLSKGSLADAMRATMAFPLAFTGVEDGGRLLMDGGMVAPVPVEVARSLGDSSSFVVAVNTTSPLLPKEKLKTPLDIAHQVTTIMTADQLADQMKLADFVITPDLRNYSAADFNDKDSLIAIGYRIGKRAADSIIAVLSRRPDTAHLFVASVKLNQTDSVLAFALRTQVQGKTLTRKELQNRLSSIVRDFGLFELDATLTRCSLAAQDPVPMPPYCLAVSAMRTISRDKAHIRFSGVTHYPVDSLVHLMDLPNSEITAAVLGRSLERVLNLYHLDGYDLADVRGVTIDPDSALISITIDEAVISRIDVEKNRRTRDWLVRSYAPLRVGQLYSTRRADQGTDNLYGTDLFERVSIIPRRERDSAVADITVEERPSVQVRLGWHWDDEFQSEQFAELLNDNLMGVGLEYLLHAQYSKERQLYYGEMKLNRIFKSYLTSQLQLYHSRLDRPLYAGTDSIVAVRDEDRTGASLRVGQQIARLGTVSGGLKIEQVQFKDSRGGGTQKLNLSILSIESLVETFDRWPYPSSGKKHLLELQSSGKALGGEAEFTKFFTSLEAYFPLGHLVNYHPRLSIGLSKEGLPPTEQFYMGGQQSFAGLKTFQRSGDKMFLLNQELRFKLPFRFYLIGRYDLGEVYSTIEQVKLRNLHHGVGLTLAYDSFLGPVELAYGASDSDNRRVYFSAGLSF